MSNNDFEKNLEQLEQIVNSLEKGDLTLDDSIKLFEKGMEASKKCKDILDKSERKITMLLKDQDKIIEKEFDDMKVPD